MSKRQHDTILQLRFCTHLTKHEFVEAKELLNQGLDINLNSFIGCTLIQNDVDDIETVEFLVKNKIDINEVCQYANTTLLDNVLFKCYEKIAIYLIKLGAKTKNVNLKGNKFYQKMYDTAQNELKMENFEAIKEQTKQNFDKILESSDHASFLHRLPAELSECIKEAVGQLKYYSEAN